MVTSIDDTDSRISYSGSWQAYSGGTQSSRQWESSIHSTNQHGASATITFIGTSVKVYFTVPSGAGTDSIATFNLDGQQVAVVTRISASDPVYYDAWYTSGSLANVQHTIVITNGGSSSDSPLQLDALDIEGDVLTAVTPTTAAASSKITSNTPTSTINHSKTSVSAFSSSASSSSSSHSDLSSSSSNIVTTARSSSNSSTSSPPGSTATTVSYWATTVTASDGEVSTQTIESPVQTDIHQSSSRSSTPIGAIVGAVVGGVAMVFIVLLLLCLRRRRRRQGSKFMRLGNAAPGVTTKPTNVTPFNLEENNSPSRTDDEPPPNQVGESSRGEKPGLAGAAAAADGPSSPSDELVDIAFRRWIERHPEVLVNNSTMISTYLGQSQTDARHHDPRRYDAPPEEVELGTFSSMYASTSGGRSTPEHPPPAYHISTKNDPTSHRQSASMTSPTSLLSPSSPTTEV